MMQVHLHSRTDNGLSVLMRKHFRFVKEEKDESHLFCKQQLLGLDVHNNIRVNALIALMEESKDLDFTERRAIVIRYLRTLSKARPLVILFDDAHWNLDILQLVATMLESDVSEQPILFVLTVRDDLVKQDSMVSQTIERILKSAFSEQIPIGLLTQTEMEALVHDLLKLEKNLASRVAKQSGGSPLFAVQLVQDWVAKGYLEPGIDGFLLQSGNEIRLPKDIHDLWESRVAPLWFQRPGDKVALEIAAALGEQVRYKEWELACSYAGVSEPVLLLQHLMRLELGFSIEGGWRFCHSMLRTSIIETCKEKEAWVQLNRICARVIEEKYPNKEGRFYARHANYLIEGKDFIGALDSLIPAALHLYPLGDFDEAHRLLNLHLDILNALGVPEGDEKRIRYALERGKLLVEQSNYALAKPYLEDAKILAIGQKYHDMICEVELGLAKIHLHSSDLSAAKQGFVLALGGFQKQGNIEGEASCYLGLARVAEFGGQYEEGVAFVQSATTRFESISNVRELANVYNAQGDIYRAMGDYKKALVSLENARYAFEKIQSQLGIADCMHDRAILFRLSGYLDNALSSARHAYDLYQEMNSKRSFVVVLHLGWIHICRGEYTQSVVLIRKAQGEFRQSGQEGLEGESFIFLMVAFAGNSDWGSCKEMLVEALRVFKTCRWRSPEILEALVIFDRFQPPSSILEKLEMLRIRLA